MKILADQNMPLVEQFFKDMGKVERFDGRQLTPEKLIDVDVLLTRSVTQVNSELLAQANKLSFVGTATIGVDHIDTDLLNARNIDFTSAPGCNAIAVAEYVISSLFALSQENAAPLSGQTIGIVGVGNIGSCLAQKLKALNVDVLLCDPIKHEQGLLAEHVELDELLERVDAVTFHVPLIKTGEHKTHHLIDEKRKIHICSNGPECPGFFVETGNYKIKGYDGPVLDCDKCGSEMQLKSGRFGKYFGCTECSNTRKLLRSGEPAPPKADPVSMPELKCEKVPDHYLLRDGASGIFLAASQFPKHRETRAPKVSEIKPHANELDPKFRYLVDAPETDPQGNPAIIRFSRKTKEQYVQSEVEGKATGWKAFYQGKSWVQEQPPKKGTKLVKNRILCSRAAQERPRAIQGAPGPMGYPS